MTEFDIKLPRGWTERTIDDQSETIVVEYHREPDANMVFLLSVILANSDENYKLRFSTVSRSPNRVRHDYPVGSYDSQRDAANGVKTFLEHFSREIHQERVSATEPEIEEIQRTIREYRDEPSYFQSDNWFDVFSNSVIPVGT